MDATTRMIAQASTRPAPAPSRPTTALSVSSWRTTRAARADRQTDADFLLPARCARKEHARDIRARDQQHQPDDEHQAGGDRTQHAVGSGYDVDIVGAHGGGAAVFICLRERERELA